MRFNAKKWEGMLRRKEALHQAFISASGDFDHAKREYSRARGWFGSHFGNSYGGLCDAIDHDARRMATDEIDDLIDTMVRDWPASLEKFLLSDRFDGKSHVVALYRAMRDMRSAGESRDLAAAAQRDYGACFSVLIEFARRMARAKDASVSVVPESPAPVDYFGGDYD